jgi:hypothetical protein
MLIEGVCLPNANVYILVLIITQCVEYENATHIL